MREGKHSGRDGYESGRESSPEWYGGERRGGSEQGTTDSQHNSTSHGAQGEAEEAWQKLRRQWWVRETQRGEELVKQ